VKEFCRKQGVGEAVFYAWRKRLAEEQQAARFALVAASGAPVVPTPALQLLLANGDRLEIASGVDGLTLRTVIAVLRERV
jgi:transposase-like protein